MTERETIDAFVSSLGNAERHNFPETGSCNTVPVVQGIYLIAGPDNHVLHIGRSVRRQNGLRGRINDHLKGRSSFVRAFLARDRQQLRRGYTFQYIEIPDDRERALAEAAAIGWYCPKHLGLGAR